MHNDNINLAYLKFLYPILEEVAQSVNKSFESNTADPSKLLKDLINLIYSISKRFDNPNCREHPLTWNSYIIQNVYFWYKFDKILAFCLFFNEKKEHLKKRCLSMVSSSSSATITTASS